MNKMWSREGGIVQKWLRFLRIQDQRFRVLIPNGLHLPAHPYLIHNLDQIHLYLNPLWVCGKRMLKDEWLDSRKQSAYIPFCLGPEQVWPQDDGDVRGGHLVHIAVLRQLSQELHQVSATHNTYLLYVTHNVYCVTDNTYCVPQDEYYATDNTYFMVPCWSNARGLRTCYVLTDPPCGPSLCPPQGPDVHLPKMLTLPQGLRLVR